MSSSRETTADKKRTNLYLVLCSIVIVNALLAEIIGVKIFSAESYLGIAPAQISLLEGFTLDFNLTSGVIIWPVVFVTSDLINEYFGRKGTQKISILTAILIAYAFVIIWWVTSLPPAQFWVDINQSAMGEGSGFNINIAFSNIFRQGLGIIIGSLTAFLIGQMTDAYTFHWLRSLTGSKYLMIRATGSTLVSQLIDSFVVLYIAFYVFGNWSASQVISVGIINYIYKGVVAVLLTPVLYIAHDIIDKYLGVNHAEKIIEEAADKDNQAFEP